MDPTLVKLLYLAAAVLFIFGLKGLTHPRTAVRGNQLGALGMLLAIIATVSIGGMSWGWVLAGLAAGGAIGATFALKVQMTGMPQLVALFNGFGGAASFFVAGAMLANTPYEFIDAQGAISTALSGLIGAVTLTGSLVAFAKLQEVVIDSKPILLPNRHLINAGVAGLAVILTIVVSCTPWGIWYWLLVVVALALGIALTIPIGGADMPVVISLLNSYSGLAAAATGFVIGSEVLIISGSLVGASGIILTRIMCVAMNRSLANVLFGGVGSTAATGSGPSADEVYAGKVKSTSPEEVAMMLDGVQKVMVVPGYGMAVAQCQHAVRDLANLLEAKGVEVLFAVHPVAGRMPGHMNVLLAEANIDYDKLIEMDTANPMFPQTDLTIVLGANDVVNPDARTDPDSPIAGMPILDVDKSRTVVVIKRSLSPGFAGIPNPLFAAENTLMLFGDGKKAMIDLVAAVKEG